MKIGYCTNIHPGSDVDNVVANLERYTKPVRQAVSPNEPMGLGLWLSDVATSSALMSDGSKKLKSWLESESIIPYTFNAFPFCDFHQPVVKHLVYQPTWADPARLEYTARVAELMDYLLPPGEQGSISTLPLGWPAENTGDEFQSISAAHLSRCAEQLEQIENDGGRRIILCIEPEPGCILQKSHDMVQFFNDYLLRGSELQQQRNRRYLGICHDVCHAAVMFEDQWDVLDTYAAAEINVGKVQISSAIESDFEAINTKDRDQLISQMRQFIEPRYLHQTVWKKGQGEEKFFEDMPEALDGISQIPSGISRTHFHVPIYATSIGRIKTTQEDILECLSWYGASGLTSHFEVETYAWNVSPESLRTGTLVESITKEVNWLYQQDPAVECYCE